MSRSAIIASLALHAGLLFLVGWRSASTVARIGPGPSGADATFLLGDAGSLANEPTPSLEPATDLQPPAPEFIPSKPAVIPLAPPISVISAAPNPLPLSSITPHEMPAMKVKASFPTGSKSVRRMSARNGGSSDGQQGKGEAGGGGGLHGPGYVPPQYLVRYKPLYPEEARAKRLEGSALLLVSIDTAGHVTSTSVQRSCGHPVLDRAALAAVRSWRFDPARQDGVAISAEVEVPVRFRFEERSTTRS